jgi:RecB family exonuclease
MERVSVSEIRTFQRCQREHALGWTQRFRPLAPAALALRFGTLIHAAMESWWLWRPGGDIGRLDAALLRIAHAAAEPRSQVNPVERVRAEELIRGYDARWGVQDLETLAVEAEFSCELTDSIELVGRIDALARDPSGCVWVVEHKTAENGATPAYWARLRLDLQCSVYLIGARALGQEPIGALYDVIGKPRLYPRVATPPDRLMHRKDGKVYSAQREEDESLDDFRARLREHIAGTEGLYIRNSVMRLEMEREEALQDLRGIAAQIVAARAATRAGKWIVRNTDACTRYSSLCDFFGVCTHDADINDRAQFQRRTHG